MGPFGFKKQTRRMSKQHSQAEWREIGYREYVRWRDEGDSVTVAFGGAVTRATGWAYTAREPEIMRFKARYQQDAIAEATRQAALAAVQDLRAAHQRRDAAVPMVQGHLFAEGA